MHEPIAGVEVERWNDGRVDRVDDALAVEEPCEIRLGVEPVAVVMRTPGHDADLAAGFLYTEAIIEPDDIGTISHCRDVDALNPENLVEVRLVEGREPRDGWQRNFYAASSCGICGKGSIEAIRVHAPPVGDGPRVARSAFQRFTEALRGEQSVFDATGGLHGAALFAADGSLVVAREDVGRHNAVDKVIGASLLRGLLPLDDHVLMVSGRTSFEIVQKALVAGIAIVAGVSAASSLAVDLAREGNMTLAGFVRGTGIVIYCGEQRLI